MQDQADNSSESSRSVVLLLGSVALIGVTTAYFCLPAMKGSKKTTEPTPVVMNQDLLPKKTSVIVRKKDVSLNGIFYTKDNPLAVVDGEMVREGDVINGVKVIRIHQSKVEFEFSGHKWTQEI